jgi:hypothetical protein
MIPLEVLALPCIWEHRSICLATRCDMRPGMKAYVECDRYDRMTQDTSLQLD